MYSSLSSAVSERVTAGTVRREVWHSMLLTKLLALVYHILLTKHLALVYHILLTKLLALVYHILLTKLPALFTTSFLQGGRCRKATLGVWLLTRCVSLGSLFYCQCKCVTIGGLLLSFSCAWIFLLGDRGRRNYGSTS